MSNIIKFNPLFGANDNDFKNKDQQLLQIHNAIEAKEQMLLDKKSKLRVAMQQNNFLNNVKDDYSKYYNFIAEQKREQIKAFNRLSRYINELNQLNNLNSNSLVNSQNDEKKILQEVKNIKKRLNSIISNSK
jgi:hypothetical protein